MQEFTKKIIGTWALKQCSLFDENNHPQKDYFENAIARIMYDTSGVMSVHIMHEDYAKHPITFPIETNDYQLLKETFFDYVGYFGTYEIDDENHLVTHHVVGSNIPSLINRDLERLFVFESDSILKLRNKNAEALGGAEKVFRELVWERYV